MLTKEISSMSDNAERKQFNVRIPRDLIEFLKVQAKKEHRTVVSQLIHVLRKEQNNVAIKEKV